MGITCCTTGWVDNPCGHLSNWTRESSDGPVAVSVTGKRRKEEGREDGGGEETKDVEKPVPDRGRKVERLFVITFLSIRYRARLSTPLCRSFQFFPFPFFLFLFFLPPLHSCFPPPFSPSPLLSFENPCQPTGNAILQIFFPPHSVHLVVSPFENSNGRPAIGNTHW